LKSGTFPNAKKQSKNNPFEHGESPKINHHVILNTYDYLCSMGKTLTVREMPKWDRPREKMMVLGPGGLSETELLAIILQCGTRGETVISMSQRMLRKGLMSLSTKSIRELRRTCGIGFAKATQIAAVFELARRIAEERAKPKTKINNISDIADVYIERLSGLNQERFIAVFLDTRNNILAEKTITLGILDSSIIHPRELFGEAVRESASRIILIHNHPSGDPEPSKEDINVTKALKKAADVMGIPLMDHIIIGAGCYKSVLDSF